jgi:hypothetical protein
VKSERLASSKSSRGDTGRAPRTPPTTSWPDYIEWDRQDCQDAVEGIRQGLEEVKAGRTKPAHQFLEEFARAHELPC